MKIWRKLDKFMSLPVCTIFDGLHWLIDSIAFCIHDKPYQFWILINIIVPNFGGGFVTVFHPVAWCMMHPLCILWISNDSGIIFRFGITKLQCPTWSRWENWNKCQFTENSICQQTRTRKCQEFLLKTETETKKCATKTCKQVPFINWVFY